MALRLGEVLDDGDGPQASAAVRGSRTCHWRWRGKPLVTHQVIVNLIAATTTKAGLKVNAAIDPNRYPTGRKVTDAEMAALNITHDDFHGEWNYTLHPTP
jgi:hypothetical protein